MYRGRRQHDAWLSTHGQLWPDDVVKRANDQLAFFAEQTLSGTDANHNEKIRFKTQVRGGMSVDMMRCDRNAYQIEHALAICAGIQEFLNKCFAADLAVTKYTQRLQLLPDTALAQARDANAELCDLRRECIDRNLEILSGDAGMRVLERCTEYFVYDGWVWEHWRLSPEQKYQCGLDIICVMQDVYHRVVFKMDVPKHDIFEVCRVPEGEHFNSELVERTANRLRARRAACSGCVDICFTHVWCCRLLDMGEIVRRKAHRSLCDILAVLRVTSTNVERKHLVGQELRVKKRGAGRER